MCVTQRQSEPLEAQPMLGSRNDAGLPKKRKIWKRRCYALDWHNTEQKVPKLCTLMQDGKAAYCRSCFDAFQTLGLWRSLHESFGMISTDASEEALAKEFHLLHYHAVNRSLLPFLKYKTSANCAWGLDDTPPVCPSIPGSDSPHLVGGTYYAFSQRMKRQDIKLRLCFFMSVLMLKKGLPRPTKEDCRDAVVKAYSTMTTPVVRKDGDEKKIRLVGHYLNKVCIKLFGSTKIDWDRISMRWPSTSAHHNWSRKEQGALGAIRQAGLMPAVRLLVLRARDDWCLPEEWGRDTELVVDATALEEGQRRLVEAALCEKPLCSPQALPEPLKIRVVTAGPPLTYSALAPIQKILHRVTANDPRFAIAKPLDGSQIFRLLGDLLPGNKWLSGDYKAATDNLAKELSELAVNAVAKALKMPPEYHTLLMRAMTQHVYTYDRSFKGEKDWAPELPQLRGQLMGSPVSFPFLCLANFALIWCSVFPTLEFEKVRCIVNGDDCLFQASEDDKRKWESMADAVGLTPSVGKCYYNERFMVINSETYLIDDGYARPANWSGPERIPFMNYGLILGLKRSGDRETSCEADDDPTSNTIGARCRALIRDWKDYSLCGRDAESYLVDMFLDFNQSVLPARVPLHVSEAWGGLGIPETVERRLAAWKRWDNPVPGAIKRRPWSDIDRLRPLIRKDMERRAKLEVDSLYSGRSPDDREVVKLKTKIAVSAHQRAQQALSDYGRRFSDVPDDITAYQWFSLDEIIEEKEIVGERLTAAWDALPEQATWLTPAEFHHYLYFSPLKRRLRVNVSVGERDWDIQRPPIFSDDVIENGRCVEAWESLFPGVSLTPVVATTLNKGW